MGYGRCPSFVGREISYCHSCGHRLVDTESDDTRPYLHEGRRFCKSCCPSQPIPVPQRRQTSTRLRMPPGPAPKPRETTRIRKRNPVAWIVAGSTAAALAVAAALASAGSPAPEPVPVIVTAPAAPAAPTPAPAPSLDQLFARIREIRQSDLMFERRDEVLGLLKDAGARSGPRLEEVDQAAAEYDRKFEQAAARIADFTRSEAMRMAAKQKYAEAIERLDGYPAAFRTSKAAEPLRTLRRDFERRRLESPSPAAAPQRQIVGTPRWRS
jgi:hypothetical protein